MKQLALHLILVLFAITFLTTCNDPTTLGSDILSDDTTQLEFFDTLTIEAVTEIGEALPTNFAGNDVIEGFLFGNMVDPVFGKSESSIFFQVVPRISETFILENPTLDSVILNLPYYAEGFYGRQPEEYTIDILRMSENVDGAAEYFSDTSFQFADTLASVTVVPSVDSVSYTDYSGIVPVTVSLPTLRIPLNLKTIGAELFSLDSVTLTNNDLFLEVFNGIHLRPGKETQGMIAFDLLTPAAGLFYYYSEDSTFFQYQFALRNFSLKFLSFEHDYANTPVETAVDNDTENLIFTQGLSGVVTKLKFPTLDNFRDQDFVVNKAELEISIATLDDDRMDIFTPPEQLVLAFRNEDGDLQAISDVLFGLRETLNRFGGSIEDNPEPTPDTYTMNISTHFQDMLDGVYDPEMYILVSPKVSNASRVVLFGPDHPEYSIKLRVTGTNVSN
ncbi:MAG: DUF4270 family protein [Bacteroidota bacterium]